MPEDVHSASDYQERRWALLDRFKKSLGEMNKIDDVLTAGAVYDIFGRPGSKPTPITVHLAERYKEGWKKESEKLIAVCVEMFRELGEEEARKIIDSYLLGMMRYRFDGEKTVADYQAYLYTHVTAQLSNEEML